MAALVQSFPQQSTSVTMLQTHRPSSSSGQSSHHHHNHRSHQQGSSSRSPSAGRFYNNAPPNQHGPTPNTTTYRGQTTHAPVAPYAFTSTPGNASHAPYAAALQSHPQVKTDHRAHSASPPFRPGHDARWQTQVSSANGPPSLPNPLAGSNGHQDDSLMPPTLPRPTLDTSVTSGSGGAKPSPDRYRRPHRRPESTMSPTVAPSSNSSNAWSPQPTGGAPHMSAPLSYSQVVKGGVVVPTPQQLPHQPHSYDATAARKAANRTSVDDFNINRHSGSEQAKRYRRRSISSLDASEYAGFREDRHAQSASQSSTTTPAAAGPAQAQRPASSRGRTESAESAQSSRSNSSHPSSRDALSPLTANPVTQPNQLNLTPRVEAQPSHGRRGGDPSRRMNSPSPLSKPVAMSPDSPTSKKPFAEQASASTREERPPSSGGAHGSPESPAAQQLAALNDKEAKKKGKSRLRRAFSFGSAAELRKASAENSANAAANQQRAKLHKERDPEDVEDAEQAAIARKQEESGLGAGIYSGQGNFFTGSTDNLSISSTASSASVMIRKMGKGMKKSTRSLVGLFRPKSVVGAPGDMAGPEPSVGQVSMVTVEAEREKINVNANPHDQTGGGTGFPKLERNSMETGAVHERSRGSGDSLNSRRSIVGGEKERAEVLAAVKKGILKRSGTDSGNSSPITRPAEPKAPGEYLPSIPHFTDTPRSSAPSTPNDERPSASASSSSHLGHRRTDSVTIEGEDYFMTVPRFPNGDTKSAPNTPQSMSRNISFSPRIQFHDTWPSGEYDRRGDVATCNRLTPMLAQQIKEELNSFKMEMEVHEQSKVYTHFF